MSKDGLAKYKDRSKAALAMMLEGAKRDSKRSHQIGSPAITAVGYSANIVARHSMNSMLGPANTMSNAQKLATGLVTVGLLGVRLGLSGAKDKATNVAMASACEGVVFAGLERLVEGLANITPA